MSRSKIKIAFVFPGFGPQWKRMGAGLLKERVFRAVIRACDKQFSRYVDWHIEEEIQKPVEISKMEETLIGYPCSLAIEVALMELLKSWGIVPDAVIGHSGGEAAAAYAAGILNLKDTFNVIRNHHIEMEKGSGTGIMAHIGLPGEKVGEILKNPSNRWHRQSGPGRVRGENTGNPVFAAAFNSPGATVVSGERKAIEKFVESLTREKIFCRLLNTLAPFHSPLMESYREEIYNRLTIIRPRKPSIPVYSSLLGRLSKEIDYGPSYWTEHMIKPVKFARGIRAMINDGYTIFVEISPHPVLSKNIKEILDDYGKENCSVIGTLKRDEDETRELFNCFARLSIAGFPISSEKLKEENRQRLKAAITSLTANAQDSQDSQDHEVVKTLKISAPGKREMLILQLVKQSIREVLNQEMIPINDIDLGFFEMGLDSISALKLNELLSRRLGLSLPHTVLFDYPDIRSLTGYLAHLLSTGTLTGFDKKRVRVNKKNTANGDYNVNEPVAVIGMACRFPGGANNLESFWNLLKDGKDTVTGIPRERWNGDDYYSEEITPGKSITKGANFISGIDITTFDAGFFKISPKEAESLDPQQRLLLEVTIEALENAAIAPLSTRDKNVGVFIGICMDDFKKGHLFSQDLRDIGPYSGSGSMFSPAAGRVSYFLGIRGPSISIDAACSSSLAALHLAVRSLRSGECEMALAGGVNCLLSPNMFVYLTQLNTLSGDGTCKTFDENADGFGRGEGCGVFVLKKLSDAQKHHDNILAVIKGSAVNHDGASTGFTVPNGIAQQEVIYKALENGGVSPESVDYIETHGAGTSLGDPIEIGAIDEVYGKTHTMDHPVLVGSVKTNIGHLEGASGAAGMIKTVLALQNQAIPPHLHVSNPNPLIDWEHIPVKINRELTPWRRNEKPRRAGISGFGFSGSNAHIIIEEPPLMESKEPGINYPVHILNLSAQSEGALKDLVRLYGKYLSQNPLPDLSNICYTASTGRSHYNYRLSAPGKNLEEINRKLDAHSAIMQQRDLPKREFDKRIVFLYTGQGSQYVGMGSELYRVHPVFRAELDRCDTLFRPYIEKSLVELLYLSSGNGGGAVLNQALYAQPVIFSIEYALSRLWESFGVKPSVVIGHSIGEYAAACTAGVLTLEDAVKLVAVRGKLMQSVTDPGRMLGILAPEEKVRPLIHEYKDVSLAAVNAPENVTVSGSNESIEKVMEKVKRERIFIQHLNISHAFHSVMMEPYVEKFSREIEGVVFSPPELPIISAIAGKKVDKEICVPKYWSRHICQTVRFYDCMKLAEKEGYQVYVEIGGTATLAGLAGQCIPAENAILLPSLRKGREPWEQLFTSLSQLYIHGIDIDWNRFYEPGCKLENRDRAPINNPRVDGNKKPYSTRKVSLPTYPFQRKSYWRFPNSSPIVPQVEDVTRILVSGQHFQSEENRKIFEDNAAMDTFEKNERTNKIALVLKEMVHTISGLKPDDFDNDTDLFSLGLDSLMLVEFRRKIIGKYGLDISLNEFFMELTTLNKVTGYIESNRPEMERRSTVYPDRDAGQWGNVPDQFDMENGPGDAGVVERIMAQQMSSMRELAEKQLETLKNLQLSSGSVISPVSLVSPAPKKNESVPPKPLSFSSVANIGKRGLTPQQQRHLEELIKRYTKRTRTSKQLTRDYRHVLADSKTTVGFNLSTKEMLYPIIGKRARGSRIWDIDDNQYIDVTMGFGVYLFGHHPAFLSQALQERPMDDTQLGPRSYLVGEVAESIAKFTGMERVVFTNTGTEAVMTAIRLARAATGRTKIAMFSRSYHGHSDATLAVSFTRDGKLCSEPVSPGIPPGVVGEVLVVDYLDPRSLEIISAHCHQLAAVLVEPVQSRYPGVQPGEFLEQLSQITRRSGTALIFDEMITGFRLHPGGAQAYFNVEADLCTYGKIIGGGLPIGVIAGKGKYLDGIDGGSWDYGDGSYPRVERTFFGGTFCQYHEAMAAARAVLQYLGEQGPGLQKQLNRRTEKFAETLNSYFEQTGISMRIAYCSSIFRFDIPGGMDLFFYHLLEKGVYVWEWRSCFLSTAHTDEDLDYVIDAVKESIDELQSGGFSLKGAARAFHVKGHYYPMSSVQKRLYALSQTEEGDRAYHLPAALRIDGELDIKKVESVFKKLIRRHDILRTGLEIKDEELVQRVYANEEVEFSLIYHNYPGWEESEENIQRLVEEVLQPFDLSKPPLMRVSVTMITPARFILITNFHHTIFDGTSAAILAQDFMGLYQGSEMPPLKMQYKDYTYREQHDINSPDFRAHREFWVQQLAGELPVLALPTDFPRPTVLDFAGKTLRFKIGKEKTASMKGLARETNTSLNMVLLAIFNVLLFKLTGQEDICVGIPVDIRGHGDFQHTLGMFTNTLVLRNHPIASKSFPQLLKEMKIHFLQSYAHQEFPYEELVASVGNQRDIGRNPFFDVIFSFEIGDHRIYKIPGLTFTTIDINPGASPFDLFFEIAEEEGHLHVGIFYRISLFKEETIKRWGQYFETLIDQILLEPGSLVSALDMLTEPEKQTLLQEFNDTTVDYPKDRTIHQLFREHVEKKPNKIALAAHSLEGSSALTYRELDEKSNQLAHLLRAKGVDPDTNSIVAIMEERSVEMIVGIISILKAGGAYLPIDPDYPGERINYMLTDSNAGILLSKVSELSKESGGIEVIDLLSFIVENEDRGPTHLTHPTHLCYVLYTSGSTGGPKGVMVEHRNVVRLVKQANYVELSGETRILQTGAPVFDATTFEIWGALLNGGQLFLVDKDTILDAGQLGNALLKYRVNVLWLTSPLFNQLVRQDSNIFSTLEWLLVGGDVLSPQRIDAVRKRNRDLKIVNGYGPTENTTFSTTYLIQTDFEGDIPIGKPISNSTVYILDHINHLQPLGVVGELCVGGDGVSRGYLNNPELTAEKFIEYRSYRTNRTYIPSQKIYKTGDLARWLVDGNIEFLGRRDQQVKIRGFRIELGEIESKLLCHEDIKDAVVIAGKGEDEPGDRGYLCAYIVSDKAVEIPGLMEHLSGELPGYMMPSYFIRIDKIPLTPNGKIDMKALPSPEVKAGKDYTAPRNEIEEKLVEIWSRVLKIDKEAIGINSNFFHLGGHSLKAAIVINKIEKEFGTTIKFGTIFASPTVWSISRIIMGAAGDRHHRYSSIEPVEKKDYYELSSAQKRLYIIHQMDKSSIGYNMPGFFQLGGDIDKGRLESIFRKLIKRHESLRTSFHLHRKEDQSVQRIHDKVEFKIEYYNLAAGNTEDKKLPADIIRPFDLSQAPLLRVGLIKLEEEKYILMIDMHHIISDGISIGIFFQDFQALGGGRELPGLRLQYKDFSMWQNSLMVSKGIKDQEEYWVNRFSDEIPVLNLPFDYLRPSTQRFEGSVIRFEIGKEQTEQLKQFGLETSTTMYTVLLAVFNIFLSKLTGQEDIIVGSPTAGRRHHDLEDIMGMFVNTLVLRNNPSGEKPFTGFLQEVKACTLQAFENQDYQYEELVDKVVKTRDMRRNPLFDVVFALENIELNKEFQEMELEGLTITPYEYEEKVSKFDITLLVKEGEKNLFFTFEYSTKLFEKTTVGRFVSCFKKVLSSVLEGPGKPLQGIEIIPDEEKNRILTDFNDTNADYPRDKTIHRLFEEQVEKRPDGVAVIGVGSRAESVEPMDYVSITYGELNRKSNRLAQVLREKGVLVDTIVGIMVERSLEMIAGIMAILKAGGAYLPIDPVYPEERINYMLTDSNARILLSEVSGGTEVIDLPSFIVENENRGPTHLTHLCYVIYTSGTTGGPKGVMVEHSALINFVYSMYRDYVNDFGPGDNCLSLTNICFDVSVCELFLPLSFGSRIVLPPGDKIYDVEELSGLLVKQSITFTYIHPGLLKEVAHSLRRYGSKLVLNKLLVGVEPIRDDILEEYKELNKGMRIVNGYGPTEATICATTYMYQSHPGEGKNVPIGSPLANTCIMISDGATHLVPVGVAGQLCIAGDGLARGYLNQPELTAEKFDQDEKKNKKFLRGVQGGGFYKKSPPGRRRLYKTGDMARWLPDGNIVFLGRIDDQVKIRGFRIEPGEIASRLLKHKKIKETVVIVRTGMDGDKYLCAYIVSDQELNALELKEHLGKELPGYMIPSYFIQLDRIPLNQSGKVDRSALPEPEMKVGEDYAAPRDDIERTLVELWSKVLGVQESGISIDGNFFQLGGQSLKATFLAAKIYKALNVKLPLDQVFKTPTIRGLAGYIKSAVKDKYTSIEPTPLQEYYPLSSAQKRLYIVHQLDETGIGYNMPGIFLLEGVLDAAKLEAAFKGLIQRHESFRTSFHLIREQPVQKIHEQVEFAIEYYDTSENFIRPFDLSHAPLLRVGLIKLEEEKPVHILMFDMHHIVSDGISIKIFLHNLKVLYGGRVLPELRLQYKDFSRWQNNVMASGSIKKQEEYWLDRFRDEIPVLNLPTDYSRPPVQRFEGSHIRFEIGKELTGPLKQLSLDTGATLYMVLLAVFNIFLGKLTGQEDIAVGGPAAGRRHDELENIVGMFVNTLVLRNNPAGEKTFTGFLEEVKECTLTAFENQDYQYEELVDQAVKTRDMSRNPLFDVVFAFQDKKFNLWSQKMELTGLNVSPYEYEKKISKFDMSLFGEEMEEKGKMVFTFDYSTNLFKKETIERFVSYFKNVLSGVLPDPGTLISGLEIIGDEEKRRVLTDFNDTAAAYPGDKTIHQLFEEQAERTPDGTAVVCVGQIVGVQHVVAFHDVQLTYRELDEKSNQLAHLLKEKGVGPNTIIGIMVEPSVEMVIDIMGILKAGGAYLPIDPESPRERIDYLLADSGTTILLTNLSEGRHIEFPASLLPCFRASHPSSLAYLIYTSGTTGRPRGVLVTHQGAVNTLTCRKEEYKIDANAAALQLFSYVFDGFVTALFTPVISGAKVILPHGGALKDIAALKEIIVKQGITHFISVPVLYAAIFETLTGEEAASLKLVTLAGDRVLPELLEKTKAVNRNLEISIEYGVTEASVMSTISRHQEIEEHSTIGYPAWNTRVYILDKNQNLQPPGVPGELCISGVGLARGYLNNPELTAERFFPVFYRSNRSYRTYSSERVYKTGDLARWLVDGSIEFLGRIDSQVKIRGYRIEPGEIESRLLRHNGIAEAIVLVGRDESGDSYLCAYIVPHPVDAAAFADPSSIQGELKKHLSQFLPDYMIPTRFVSMEKMPLTPSGKVDRKVLPTLGAAAGVEYAAPRSEMEDTLARLWSQVLGIEKEIIGIDDNFIERGGQSLKAILLIAKIHQTFNVRLSLAKFFEIPVIRQLSQLIKTTARDQYIAVQSIEKKQYYGLSSAQKRLYVIQQIEPHSTTYNMPMVVVLEGRLEKEKLEAAFRKLIDRHESLRTSIEMVSRQPMQKIHDELPFEIEYHDAEYRAPGVKHSEQSAGRPASIIEAFIRPFDLSQAPYIRAGLIKTGKQEHILMVDMHHIVSDANSHEILMKEFSALYHGETLPALKLQYRDFCQWQNKLLISGEMKKQEEYWLKEFKGKIPVLKMPTNYSRSKMMINKGRTVAFEIASGEAGNLRALARREDATMFTVLLALFNIFLYKISRQEDIVTGTIVAGRRHVDLENIIGVFINTLALRNYPRGDQSFIEFLREVRERTLAAFDNQDYQFEDLVEKVMSEREVGRNPLFDVLFSFSSSTINEIKESSASDSGRAEGPVDPGLEVKPYEESEETPAKFDMIFTGGDTGKNLFFVIEYNTGLFQEETIERFIEYFKEIVSAVRKNESIRLKDIKVSCDLVTVTSDIYQKHESEFEF